MHASVTTRLKDSLTVKARLTPAKPTAARIGICLAGRLGGIREADGHEARGRDQRFRQHREGGRSPGEGGGALAVPSLFEFHEIVSIAMVARSRPDHIRLSSG
jgi:hypothetical protein